VAGVRSSILRVSRMMCASGVRIDCQPTMHDACVKLSGLGKTNREPDAEYPGQALEEEIPPRVSHVTNIEVETLRI
jgi:hypothetical protein